MARISLDPGTFDPRPGLFARMVLRAARRKHGTPLDTVSAMSHHRGVLLPWVLLELANQRRRSALPDHLDSLVEFVAAVRLGCSWCIDFGASLWERQRLDPAILRAAAAWRDSTAFDQRTRAAFEYTEALCGGADAVDDDLAAAVRAGFGEAGLVEISYLAALENMRSRFNRSLGLTSQGFSSGEACDLAADRRR